MNFYREKYLSDLAEEIANRYCSRYKVDLFKIAQKEHITISEGDYDNFFEALIEYSPTEKVYPFHIYLNNNIIQQKTVLRLRSTIGHELGHYFIPEHKKLLMSGISLNYVPNKNFIEDRQIEQEAQCFSGNLLMPKNKFKTLSYKYKPGLTAILKLSDKFQTTILSTALHYVKHDIVPSVLIKWKSNFEFDWKYVSHSFKRELPESFYFQFNPIRPISDCDTIRIRIKGNKHSYESSVTNLSSWVVGLPTMNSKNMTVFEHSMALGKYGGISILFPIG